MGGVGSQYYSLHKGYLLLGALFLLVLAIAEAIAFFLTRDPVLMGCILIFWFCVLVFVVILYIFVGHLLLTLIDRVWRRLPFA
jgi:hypothetical protein